MHSYTAVIFKDTCKPYRAMYALWQLDADGVITVHGTTVVHRDACGDFQADTMETQPRHAYRRGCGHRRGSHARGCSQSSNQ